MLGKWWGDFSNLEIWIEIHIDMPLIYGMIVRRN